MAAETAEEVARRVLDAVEREDWYAYAALIEPDLLEQWREERVDAETRSGQTGPPLEAFAPADAPEEVRAWFLERRARHVDANRLEHRYAGVQTLEELESLPAEELFVRRLQAHKPPSLLKRNVPDEQKPLVEEAMEVARPSLELVGMYAEGRALRHVLFRASHGPLAIDASADVWTFTLGAGPAGWRVIRLGALPAASGMQGWYGWSPALHVIRQEGEELLPGLVIDPLPWAERTFPSGLPVGLFPALLARFESNVDRLTPLLFGTPRRGRTMRPPDGKWSMQEHVGHLLEIERLADVRLGELERGAEELSGMRASERGTDNSHYNEQRAEEICSELAELRRELVARLERLSPASLSHSARHPRLNQPMNVMDLLYFMCEHDDHHLVHMRRLQQAYYRSIMEGA